MNAITYTLARAEKLVALINDPGEQALVEGLGSCISAVVGLVQLIGALCLLPANHIDTAG